MECAGSTTFDQANAGNFVLEYILLQIIPLTHVRFSDTNRRISATAIIRSVEVGTVKFGLSRRINTMRRGYHTKTSPSSTVY